MGLPPTSSKISSDSNEVTTFKFDFPNFTGTHTGAEVSLAINSAAGGGTGQSSLTLNNVILGNGTSPVQFVSPVLAGNVLTDNGTTWTSSTPGASVSNWISYTPTFTGLGTVALQTFWYKTSGDSVYIKGTFTTGIPTATQAQITLPATLTSQASKINGTIELCGYMTEGASNTAAFTVLIQPNVTYLTFGFNGNTGGGLNPDNGNSVFVSAQTYSFSTTAIPIS